MVVPILQFFCIFYVVIVFPFFYFMFSFSIPKFIKQLANRDLTIEKCFGFSTKAVKHCVYFTALLNKRFKLVEIWISI